jgi:hypothetical protein
MTRAQVRYGEPFGWDREAGDLLREANELRRSRALPEYQLTTVSLLRSRLGRQRLCHANRVAPRQS